LASGLVQKARTYLSQREKYPAPPFLLEQDRFISYFAGLKSPMKKVVFLLFSSFLTYIHLLAQGTVLSGSVRDSATGKPMPGVSVFLNSTSKGTITRADGTFILGGIPPGRYEVIISAVGYQTNLQLYQGPFPRLGYPA
jgi:hypothetical protein